LGVSFSFIGAGSGRGGPLLGGGFHSPRGGGLSGGNRQKTRRGGKKGPGGPSSARALFLFGGLGFFRKQTDRAWKKKTLLGSGEGGGHFFPGITRKAGAGRGGKGGLGGRGPIRLSFCFEKKTNFRVTGDVKGFFPRFLGPRGGKGWGKRGGGGGEPARGGRGRGLALPAGNPHRLRLLMRARRFRKKAGGGPAVRFSGSFECF